MLRDMGVKLFATEGTAAFLRANAVAAEVLHWPSDARSPNALDYVRQRRIDLVINIPKNTGEEELANDYLIRRTAADFGIPLITNIQLAQRLVEALSKKTVAELQIKSWQEYGAPERPSGKAIRPPLEELAPTGT
jgi:carbamoyl-phosphate synthase large subunit